MIICVRQDRAIRSVTPFLPVIRLPSLLKNKYWMDVSLQTVYKARPTESHGLNR